MTALLLFDLEERRSVAAGSLRALSEALRTELEPLMNGPLVIPEQKARLTRVGGRCADDGTLLEFDPYSPHEHRCRKCGRVYVGQPHDDWWAMGAQLWTAERAAQAAALSLLNGDTKCGELSLRILSELASRYLHWPNKDNALGPTRPFFSTYLESIWLLNLCHAISLLERAATTEGVRNQLQLVREQLIRPSRDLIAGYHEGMSNRQVWNEVAILSASHILGDAATIDERLSSPDGLHGLIANGLLEDGTWYEGENYHLFAHRGLWYGVELLRALGRPLDSALDAKYRAGFVTPFFGVLPDDTLPSRRDSQYMVSIRQWRFAEWCELGIAHAFARDGHHARPDNRLAGTLERLYKPDSAGLLSSQNRHPFSTADAERNEPAGSLSRADLSWRALLMARAELPSARDWSPGSVCLTSQGLAVIRRNEGQLYVALEGGHTGGGHGHPDRLALTVQQGHERLLEDPGTGSYVERKLHWYRSTLAHAAPVIDGASQDAVPAELLAFEDRGWAGWIKKRVRNMKPGVDVTRTVVVCEGHMIDVLEWEADREVQIDLPLARSGGVGVKGEWKSADPAGSAGLEDGFEFLENAERLEEPVTDRPYFAGLPVIGIVYADSDVVRAKYGCSSRCELWRATAPGAPGKSKQQMHWLRTRARRGRIFGIWQWADVISCGMGTDSDAISVTLQDGTEAVHAPSDGGWHIDLKSGNATSSIDLELLPKRLQPTKEDAEHSSDDAAVPMDPTEIPFAPDSLWFELLGGSYRRTEESWTEAGEPTASVELAIEGEELRVHIQANTGAPFVPDANAENELDNERADVNADGVQLYIGKKPGDAWSGAWLMVPVSAEEQWVRTTAISPGSPDVRATWKSRDAGWSMTVSVPIHAIPVKRGQTFALEAIINVRGPDRVRRRGQLVLSGGTGFAYLRGDRTNSLHARTFQLEKR